MAQTNRFFLVSSNLPTARALPFRLLCFDTLSCPSCNENSRNGLYSRGMRVPAEVSQISTSKRKLEISAFHIFKSKLKPLWIKRKDDNTQPSKRYSHNRNIDEDKENIVNHTTSLPRPGPCRNNSWYPKP